jgi:hypothetical protein
MITTAKHIIGKQLLEIQYNGHTDGIALQRTTETMLRNELLPQLEELLDRYDAVDEIISIDRLQLELKLDAGELERNLSGRIIREINKVLTQKIIQTSHVVKSDKETNTARFVKLLIFYLRNGYLPWWSHFTAGPENWHSFLYENLRASIPEPEWIALLAVIREENVRKRIAVQFDDACFLELLKEMPGIYTLWTAWRDDVQSIIEWLQQPVLQETFKVSYRLALLQLFSVPYSQDSNGSTHDKMSRQFIQMIKTKLEAVVFRNVHLKEKKPLPKKLKNSELKKTLTNINIPKSTTGYTIEIVPAEHTIQDKPASVAIRKEKSSPLIKTTEDPVYINNAGLVIVAPYLGHFFNRLELVKENKITDNGKTIALLHYMATGRTDFEEYETVLPKLLCGMNPEESLENKYQLMATEKGTAEELLQAVIDNWSILGKTSITGLRETFLQREGRLTNISGNWHLRVQQGPFDLLLDHLPWNIGTIRLSWMPFLLTVKWND